MRSILLIAFLMSTVANFATAQRVVPSSVNTSPGYTWEFSKSYLGPYGAATLPSLATKRIVVTGLTPPTPRLTLMGIGGNTSWRYALTACAGTGETTIGTPAEITTGPTTLTTTRYIRLTWTAVDGATSYNIYRHTVTDKGVWIYRYLAKVYTTSYNDNGSASPNLSTYPPISDSTGLLSVPALEVTSGAGLGRVLVSNATGTGTWTEVSSLPVEALKDNATTGLMEITGVTAGETRVKTIRDANDTIMEVGGSYTPTGTWDWVTGSPTVTWPAVNISTSTKTTGFTSGQIVGSDGANVKVAVAGTDYLTPTGSGTGLSGIPKLDGVNAFTAGNSFTLSAPSSTVKVSKSVSGAPALWVTSEGTSRSSVLTLEGNAVPTTNTQLGVDGTDAGDILYASAGKGGDTESQRAGTGGGAGIYGGTGGDFVGMVPNTGSGGYGGDIELIAGSGGNALVGSDNIGGDGGWIRLTSGQGGLGSLGNGTHGNILITGTTQFRAHGSNNLMHWDSINQRLGIGLIPTEALDVTGNIKASGTITGSGSGLTDIPDSALSSNVPLLNAANAYTNTVTYQPGAAYDTATLGAEILDDTTWNLGAGWAYVSGSDWTLGFQHTAGNTATLTQSDAATTNTYYQIAYTVTGRTAGSFTIAYGGVTSAAITATGTWGPKTTSTASLVITPTTDFDGAVVISIKKNNGYNASFTLKDSTGTAVIEARSSVNTYKNTFLGRFAGSYNTTGTNNTAHGYGALQSTTTGGLNTAVGVNALNAVTTGGSNTALGVNAGTSITTGVQNLCLGASSGAQISTGNYNITIGPSSLASGTSSWFNIALGYQSLLNCLGSANISIGAYSLINAGNSVAGSGSIAIGYCSGKYETGTSAFYVNNKDQGNTAGDKANSLLYGVMGANAAAQTLQIGGKLKIDPVGTAYSAPTEALDVAGNIKASGGVTANTFPLIQWRGSSASDPTENLAEGQMYWNTSGSLKIYTGSAWVTVGVGP